MTDQITILGVGNILLRDEGVGVRVIEALNRKYVFPDNVNLVDGGTQGLWLLPTIQQSDYLIVVDAVLGAGKPGSLYRLEKSDLPKGLRFKQSSHDSDLIEALNLCALIENGPKSVVVVGIEPLEITPLGLELSREVESRVDDMVEMVVDELKILGVTPEKIV
ncbi:MAG: HyaD/HybD family hydrogenase maturation endopeptidase [Desulfomonilaceae bacterium]